MKNSKVKASKRGNFKAIKKISEEKNRQSKQYFGVNKKRVRAIEEWIEGGVYGI